MYHFAFPSKSKNPGFGTVHGPTVACLKNEYIAMMHENIEVVGE
jgi:hypothetical protein